MTARLFLPQVLLLLLPPDPAIASTAPNSSTCPDCAFGSANSTAALLASKSALLEKVQEDFADLTEELSAERNASQHTRQALLSMASSLASTSAELAELREEYTEAARDVAEMRRASNRTQEELSSTATNLQALRSHFADVVSKLASLEESQGFTQLELDQAVEDLTSTRALLSQAWSALRYKQEQELPEALAMHSAAQRRAVLAEQKSQQQGQVLASLQGLNNATFAILHAGLSQLGEARTTLQGDAFGTLPAAARAEAVEHVQIVIAGLERLVEALPTGELRHMAIVELDLSRAINVTAFGLAVTLADVNAYLQETRQARDRIQHERKEHREIEGQLQVALQEQRQQLHALTSVVVVLALLVAVLVSSLGALCWKVMDRGGVGPQGAAAKDEVASHSSGSDGTESSSDLGEEFGPGSVQVYASGIGADIYWKMMDGSKAEGAAADFDEDMRQLRWEVGVDAHVHKQQDSMLAPHKHVRIGQNGPLNRCVIPADLSDSEEATTAESQPEEAECSASEGIAATASTYSHSQSAGGAAAAAVFERDSSRSEAAGGGPVERQRCITEGDRSFELSSL